MQASYNPLFSSQLYNINLRIAKGIITNQWLTPSSYSMVILPKTSYFITVLSIKDCCNECASQFLKIPDILAG